MSVRTRVCVCSVWNLLKQMGMLRLISVEEFGSTYLSPRPYHSSIGIQESFTFVIMCVKRNSRRCWLLAVCIGKTARTRLRCIASLSVSYSWTNLVEEGAQRLYLKTFDMSLGVNFINYLVKKKYRCLKFKIWTFTFIFIWRSSIQRDKYSLKMATATWPFNRF